MNQSFFTASVGAQQQQTRMTVQSNNIANVNNYGFKAENPTFTQLMFNRIDAIENRQIPRGTGGFMEMADSDFSDGAIVTAPIPTYYAIMGDGFFGLVDPGTGEISYTRDGSFTLSEYTQAGADGEPEKVFYLSDGHGRFVLNMQGAPVQVTDSDAELPVGVFDFVNTDGMLHLSENRFQPVEKNGQVRMGDGIAKRGMIELSNTDLATEMVKVIEAQRSYSMALKMVQTSDEIETTINSLRS